jgi:hypothetical protein
MRGRVAVMILGLVVVQSLAPVAIARPAAMALPPANEHFARTWSRTDKPVADGAASRTWMWGPEANTGPLVEAYVEGVDGQRVVQYFDKARMEITQPDADPNEIWYVTNGLLVNELVSGQMQTGHTTFAPREPAQINVAGDPDDPAGPTYATIATLRALPPLADGAPVTQRVDRDGGVTDDPALSGHGVTAAFRVQVEGIDHQVASVFWTFMQSSGTVYQDGGFTTGALFPNAFYATGYPITEAYWARVKLQGAGADVLIQCFERRCLTYTPGNPAGWQVEAGNVGQHYLRWRYPEDGPGPCVPSAIEASIVSQPPVVFPGQPFALDFSIGANDCIPAGTSMRIESVLPETLEVIGIAACDASVAFQVLCVYAAEPRRFRVEAVAGPDGVATASLTVRVPQPGAAPPESLATCADAFDGVLTGTVCATTTVDPQIDAPSKAGDPAAIVPGETITYSVTFTARPGSDGSGRIEDPVWEGFEVLDVQCFTLTGASSGNCGYDEATRIASMDVVTLAEWDTVRMVITARLPESLPSYPDVITNCATVDDGTEVTNVCAETTVN